MTLSIGRKGWAGVGFESSAGVPVAVVDYIPFTDFTLKGMHEPIKNEQAIGVRDKVVGSVIGKKWSEGDLEINIDRKNIGYLLGGALGTIDSANVAGSVYDHTFTRNNSNTPKTMTVINSRDTDKQYFRSVAVKSLEIAVSDGLATAKANLLGNFPITTTSGTLTSASGSVFAFPDGHFAFAATPTAALAATNLKLSEITITIENNTEAIHRHGSADAATINHGEFEVTAEGTMFFEDTTQRDRYYDATKSAAAFRLMGAGIGGGYYQTLTLNMYQTLTESYEVETGLSDFFAEKFNLTCEYDEANDKTIDAVLRNVTASY